MTDRNVTEVILEIVVLVIMIKPLFSLGTFIGISYLAAVAGAIWSGALFEGKVTARLLVGGTILSYVSSRLFQSSMELKKAGNAIGFMIILALAIGIWFQGYLQKRGL